MTRNPANLPDEMADLLETGLACQEQGLKLLHAEMRALATLVPGRDLDRPTEAETEAGFDNMPV